MSVVVVSLCLLTAQLTTMYGGFMTSSELRAVMQQRERVAASTTATKSAFVPMPPDAQPPQGGAPAPQGGAPQGGAPAPQGGAPAPQGGAPAPQGGAPQGGNPQDQVMQLVQALMADPQSLQQLMANPQQAMQALQQEGIPPEVFQQAMQIIQQQQGGAPAGDPSAQGGAPAPQGGAPGADPAAQGGASAQDLMAMSQTIQQLASEVEKLKAAMSGKDDKDTESRLHKLEIAFHRMEAKNDTILQTLNQG